MIYFSSPLFLGLWHLAIILAEFHFSVTTASPRSRPTTTHAMTASQSVEKKTPDGLLTTLDSFESRLGTGGSQRGGGSHGSAVCRGFLRIQLVIMHTILHLQDKYTK